MTPATVGIVAVWIATAVFSLTHRHPDVSQFDMRRCYALHQKLHCWPKHETCWFAEDRAICWRVVSLKF